MEGELWDVMYYALAIIDMESVIEKKSVFNSSRYPKPMPFQLDR